MPTVVRDKETLTVVQKAYMPNCDRGAGLTIGEFHLGNADPMRRHCRAMREEAALNYNQDPGKMHIPAAGGWSR